MKLLRKLAVLFGATVMSLLIAEGVLRLVGMQPLPRPTSEGRLQSRSDDPVLGLELVPGARKTVSFPNGNGAEPYVVVYSVNSVGIRGREGVARAKPPGTYRIACLGDSFTFGIGVGDDETWPAQLQQVLARELAGRTIEVLNFGVPAYDTEQELQALRKQALAFDPDLVLLCWYLNDTALRDGARIDGFEFDDPPRIVLWLEPSQPTTLRAIRDRWILLDLVCDRLYRRAHGEYLQQTFTHLYGDEHPGWRRSTTALSRMKQLLARRGVAFAMILYPTLVRDGEHLVSHDAYAKVARFAQGEGIPVLDLEPTFDGLEADELNAHRLCDHPGARAHSLAGEAIFGFLRERRLLGRAD